MGRKAEARGKNPHLKNTSNTSVKPIFKNAPSHPTVQTLLNRTSGGMTPSFSSATNLSADKVKSVAAPPNLVRFKCDNPSPEGLESSRTSNGLNGRPSGIP